MKKYFIVALASVAALTLASCVKESSSNMTEEKTINNSQELITITARIPEGGFTKVDMNEAAYGGAINLVWHAGDKIIVTDADDETNTQEFTLTGGAGTAEGTFTGKVVTADTYIIVYDSIGDEFEFSEQTQAADASTDHLKYKAVLTGVNDYTDFEFSETWAASAGGTYTSSSVLRVRADIAELDPGAVNAVILKSDAAIFAGGKELTVLIDEPGNDNGEQDFITIYATLPEGDQAIAAGTELIIQFQMSDKEYDKYTVYRQLGAGTITGGKVNGFNINCRDNEDHFTNLKFANKSTDNIGTAANPYLIGDQHQMVAMRSLMVEETIVYFEMVDDVDLTGIDWEPLNYDNNYVNYIHFDGQNHVISNMTVGETYNYPGFVGVLYGTIQNVVLSKASVTAGSGFKSGIVAGYVGTSASKIPCVAYNVIVKDSQITGARSMGAFAGQIATADATITDCHVYNTTVTQTATSSSHAGGFVGYSQYNGKLTDCTTDANVTGTQFTGGFAGYGGMGIYTRCYASGTVSGTKDVAGFVGKTENPVFIDCKYFGTSVTATDNTKNAHVGGFVGFAARNSDNIGGVFSGCSVDGCVMNTSVCQRVGGFVGQVDYGSKLEDCYVKDVTMTAGLNCGGFVGVDYAVPTAEVTDGGIYRCYVEGGTITAAGNNCGGFAGYPEKALITDSYSTMDVVGGAYTQVGGFIGNGRGDNVITNCFESGTITGSATSVGAFIGEVTAKPTSITKCIAWNGTLSFYGTTSLDEEELATVITGNYCGTSGTISSQAETLGWNETVWDLTGDVPALK